MRNELESALLALIALHPQASGYELHQVIEKSTGHMLSASFSQIYPALKKLSDDGLVDFEVEPIKNRPGKKRYALTQAGRAQLDSWLCSPVDLSRGFNALDLRVVFLPLMKKEAALALLDATAAEIELMAAKARESPDGRDPLSYSFLDHDAVDMDKIDFIWPAQAKRFRAECEERAHWLRELRQGIEKAF